MAGILPQPGNALITLRTTAKPPSSRHLLTDQLREDQAEDVIEHIIAACTVRKQLEDLGVIHRSLFLVDLQ